MRAAVVYEHGELDRIVYETNYAEPEPPAGWVKVRVGACSINYHDIFSRRGMPGIRLPLPLIIGSDVAGEIAEIGPNLDGWAVGDRVLIDPISRESGKGMIGEAFDGGRAEFCLAHVSQLIRMPDDVSYAVAASIPLAYATAHRMMVTRGQVSADDTVLVLGASGGVGTASVLLAKMVGARVIACAAADTPWVGPRSSRTCARRSGSSSASHVSPAPAASTWSSTAPVGAPGSTRRAACVAARGS